MAYANRRSGEPLTDRGRSRLRADLLLGEVALVRRSLRIVAAAPGHWQRTFTTITSSANRRIEPIHDRMPIILDERTAEDWIVLAKKSFSTEVLT